MSRAKFLLAVLKTIFGALPFVKGDSSVNRGRYPRSPLPLTPAEKFNCRRNFPCLAGVIIEGVSERGIVLPILIERNQ